MGRGSERELVVLMFMFSTDLIHHNQRVAVKLRFIIEPSIPTTEPRNIILDVE